jgi:N utilization substance protein B
MTSHVERVAASPRVDSRHRAREAAVQMLYQWEVGRQPLAGVLETFWTLTPPASTPVSDELRGFAARLATGVVDALATIDPMITETAVHWRLERMNVLDRLILRLAIYEFLHEPETPAKVVINEALELARTFGADDSVRFANGILDAIRKTLERE